MPPTASTHGEDAGQDDLRLLVRGRQLVAGTPRAHADEPVSPAATTVVMPSAAVAVSWRSTSVRDAVYGYTIDSHSP